jgi:EAL domain-containing protein (putative c-di-GMP-specific phosphodiesterase class I)
MLSDEFHYHIDNNHFILHYQPIVDAYTETVVGVEALVRWQHPRKGLLFPNDFIPLAEANNLIFKLDEWVLRTACRQVRRWQSDGYSLSLAVNFSGRSFTQHHLWRRVVNILEECNFDPRDLKIELTETALVNHKEEAIRTMKKLKEIDIKLALDDFGIGYSSLSYLQDFPFDILKIDRHFVKNLSQYPKSKRITTTIIELGHSLGMQVLAEGVETEEQKLFLRKHKCNFMQGYLFSPPVPAEQVPQFLIRPDFLSPFHQSCLALPQVSERIAS